MPCPIHGPIHGGNCIYTRYLAETDILLGVGGRGYPSTSRPPRTLEEACQGFKERNLPFYELEELPLEYSEEERAAIDVELGSVFQWQRRESCALSLIFSTLYRL